MFSNNLLPESDNIIWINWCCFSMIHEGGHANVEIDNCVPKDIDELQLLGVPASVASGENSGRCGSAIPKVQIILYHNTAALKTSKRSS